MKKNLPESAFSFIRSIFQKIEKSKFINVLFFLSIGQGFYIALPGLLGILIDNIFVKSNWTISWLISFPIIWLISIIFSSIGKFYSSSLTQDVRKTSKEIIFQHIINLPNRVYITRGAGEIENLMQELSLNSRYIFSESLPFFIRVTVSIITATLVMCMSSVEFLPVFIAWSCIYIVISYISSKNSLKGIEESLLSSAAVSTSTVDVIENHELVPAFGTENFEISRFEKLLEEERLCYNKTQHSIDMSNFFQQALQPLLPFTIVFLLISSIGSLQMTPGAVVSLLSITLVVATQMGDFGKGILAFLEMKERIHVALNKLICPPNIKPSNNEPNTIEPSSWNIRFENVSFNYDENNIGIKDINLKINENEKIGIIGYSGAGKTTLIKLLRGHFKPNKGSIYIDGVELDKVNPKFLTQNIAEVSQTIPLFHRTMRENIIYGCEDVNDEKIWEILEKSQMADYVKKLPDGLNTVIGVKGQKLSGGERARIAIARAFIRNAKIVILDEATAAIDSESEHLLQKSLKELMEGRTGISIAHRLSTLREVDRIVVMDKCQILAEGSHKELLSTNELYNRLWSIQTLL